MKFTLLVVILLIFTVASGCRTASSPVSNTAEKRYPMRGTVVSVDRANKVAEINNEAIPGVMEAMTMEFPIRESWVWEELSAGANIQADLVLNGPLSQKNSYWLENIAISAAPNPNQALPPSAQPAQIGKRPPAITLTDQDSKKFSLTDYKGKALAITFIYRECPLPEFCIRMSQNFSDASRLIADGGIADRARLVSISFDPARDTPAKLRQYGQGYLGNSKSPDFSIWRLAVGSDKDIRSLADFFGLKYETDQNNKAVINHSLVTAVIGPDGTVKRIFAGNRWKPDDLVQELKKTLG